MEEAQRIFEYLPVSYKNPTEKEYVEFLWDAFLTNYNAEKYPFAFYPITCFSCVLCILKFGR